MPVDDASCRVREQILGLQEEELLAREDAPATARPARRSGSARGTTRRRNPSCCSADRPPCAPTSGRSRSSSRRRRVLERSSGSRPCRRDIWNCEYARSTGFRSTAISFTSGRSLPHPFGAQGARDVRGARFAGEERPPMLGLELAPRHSRAGSASGTSPRRGRSRSRKKWTSFVLLEVRVRGRARHDEGMVGQRAVQARRSALGRADDDEVGQHAAAAGIAADEASCRPVAPARGTDMYGRGSDSASLATRCEIRSRTRTYCRDRVPGGDTWTFDESMRPQRYRAVKPASTGRTAPVILAAASDASHETAPRRRPRSMSDPSG